MREKLQELKQFFFHHLPERWGLRSKVQQITSTASQLYEIKLQGDCPEPPELNRIRQTILLHPYTISTRQVKIHIARLEDNSSEISISFFVINHDHGKQIEDTIRDLFCP